MKKKGSRPISLDPCFFLVPEERLELSRAQGPLDFESSASTCFTTPAVSGHTTNGPDECQGQFRRPSGKGLFKSKLIEVWP